MKTKISLTEQTVEISGLSAELERSITAFSHISDVPVVYYDNSGEPVWRTTTEQRVCDHSVSYQNKGSGCRRNLLSSINYAASLGEAYVFVCHGGLVNIAVSYLAEDGPRGCFIAGPLLMGELRESILTKILSVGQFPIESYSTLLLLLKSMKSRSPGEVSSLALLLSNSVVSAIGGDGAYLDTRSQHLKQVKIGSALQNQKKSHRQMEYPLDLERRMFQSVKSGESQEAADFARQLVNEICVLESSDMNVIRAKLFGLYALLVREAESALEKGSVEPDHELQDLGSLYESREPEELEINFSEIISTLSERFGRSLYHGDSEIIEKVVRYLSAKHADKISLQKVAGHFHINPSYLSSLFKQEMGLGFTEHLCRIRIKEAKRLLIDTNLTMVDIAQKCGFDDQSYFTKVFRKLEAATPKEYRKSHRRSDTLQF
jgi:AraC-like DNA-binding protein/ligand-binding sensor protein